MRVFLVTPATLAIVWVVSRARARVRENILVLGLIGVHALPLGLFWATQADLGTYVFGELALTIIYGNMLLGLRFRQAVIFTTLALCMTAAAVATKPQIPLDLQLAFMLQFTVASLFSLYANHLVEYRRCVDFTRALCSTRRAELAEQTTQLHRVMSKTDALTTLPNRRYLDEKLEDWCQKDQAIAILMIDIDHFKLFNDTLGHPAGDDCLRQIATVFKSLCQPDTVFCARFGGEEFTIVMRKSTELAAARLAQKVVSEIAALAIAHPGRSDAIGIVTASVGVAYHPKGEKCAPEAVLARADDALYRAKQLGRNGFVVASQMAAPLSGHKLAGL
ncbi:MULTISPECIES: GGDEF domain-containing protein [unclassified Yoonia]|uniref:GGDEF domain-containing protein n=1 Tax=unclassified Yoonia TaxID=2629118 RepID=UPI002AFDFAAE|nr:MULTISPECIES: GGDEF domain-containing protein [unclassified Yoonia]